MLKVLRYLLFYSHEKNHSFWYHFCIWTPKFRHSSTAQSPRTAEIWFVFWRHWVHEAKDKSLMTRNPERRPALCIKSELHSKNGGSILCHFFPDYRSSLAPMKKIEIFWCGDGIIPGHGWVLQLSVSVLGWHEGSLPHVLDLDRIPPPHEVLHSLHWLNPFPVSTVKVQNTLIHNHGKIRTSGGRRNGPSNGLMGGVLIDLWRDRRETGRTDGRMDGWMDECMDGCIDGCIDGWTDGRIGGWMDGCTDEGLTNGLTNGRMDG